MVQRPPKRKLDMVTTTVSFDRETYARLQHLAVDERVKIRELIRKAVDRLLAGTKKHKEKS